MTQPPDSTFSDLSAPSGLVPDLPPSDLEPPLIHSTTPISGLNPRQEEFCRPIHPKQCLKQRPKSRQTPCCESQGRGRTRPAIEGIEKIISRWREPGAKISCAWVWDTKRRACPPPP